MTSDLIGRIDAFAGLDVLVLGDAMLDSYVSGTSGRICREAPVPVVRLEVRRDAPGGAANTAVNVAGLGAAVELLAVLGDDCEGEIVRRCLRERGVRADGLVIEAGRRTLAKQRVMAGSQMLVRLDQGSDGPPAAEAERQLIGRLVGRARRCDALIVSDYDYGVLSPAVIRALEDVQARRPRVLVVDSRTRLPAFRGARATAVKPNYDEALHLLGGLAAVGPGSRAEAIAAHGARILERTGARIAAVTLDTDGALIFERDRPPYRTYARPERPCRAAGAGDTFVAALALALATGADATAAAELASAAAAVVVAKDDTAACSAPELRAQVRAGNRRVSDLDGLIDQVALYRLRGRRIVLTVGCFDVLHRGHVAFLNRAKELGDVLIVGLNCDRSIERLKGPGRPINTLDDRLSILAALSCVDHLVAFEADTAHELVRALRPDVFVKGGDHTRETLPEAPLVEALGGSVRILPCVADRSTADLIARICSADGAAAPAGIASLAAAAPALGDG